VVVYVRGGRHISIQTSQEDTQENRSQQAVEIQPSLHGEVLHEVLEHHVAEQYHRRGRHRLGLRHSGRNGRSEILLLVGAELSSLGRASSEIAGRVPSSNLQGRRVCEPHEQKVIQHVEHLEVATELEGRSEENLMAHPG